MQTNGPSRIMSSWQLYRRYSTKYNNSLNSTGNRDEKDCITRLSQVYLWKMIQQQWVLSTVCITVDDDDDNEWTWFLTIHWIGGHGFWQSIPLEFLEISKGKFSKLVIMFEDPAIMNIKKLLHSAPFPLVTSSLYAILKKQAFITFPTRIFEWSTAITISHYYNGIF